MAKDLNDAVTKDLIDKPKRGGYRPGSGRKKGSTKPRKQPAWRVSQEAIEAINKAADISGHSCGDILDWVMKNHKKIPNKL